MSGDRNISCNKWLRDLFFNEDYNISPIILYSQPHVERTFSEKRTVNQNNFTFQFHKRLFVKCPTLHISKTNSLLDLKRNEIIKQKLRTTWYNGKLHGSMTLGIHMLELVSWRITNNKTADYIHKYNGRPFREEKK